MATHADPAAALSMDQCEKEIMAKIAEAGLSLPVEEHPEALTVEAWQPFHAAFKTPDTLLTRCLFMKDKKKTLYLLVTLASTKTDLKLFAKQVGAKEPRFAPEDLMGEKLRVIRGAVNPFAIVNDTKKEVTLVLEEALVQSGALLCFHPSDNRRTCILGVKELLQYFEHHGRKPEIVNLVPSEEDLKAAAAAPTQKPKPKAKKEAAEKKKVDAPTGNQEGMSVKKEDNFAEWYKQVITKSEMIKYYEAVNGCYILRPWAFNIWKNIERFLDGAITDLGVEPCYFPMFVKESALKKEAGHIEGFSAEVAWVTKSGGTDLEEPIAIRPTSETVMYPSFKDWIRSHRDLPLRLNQWCNVVRWEFSHPTPFIRCREFLWQEGHTAHATEEEAGKEVLQILDFYEQVYRDLLAVPVVKGKKTEKEKFAGGHYTTTVEAFIPTVGKAVQGATSHCLGTNFAKMFEIKFQDEKEVSQFVWQNSWGLTIRTIGVMVMVHGDDKGLVLPPRVAPVQCVFVPVGINAKTKEEDIARIHAACEEHHAVLKKAGVRSKLDPRDNVTSGAKCNHWELRGVPLRIEVGPKELEKNVVCAIRRLDGKRLELPVDGLAGHLASALEEVQADMLAKAIAVRNDRHVLLKGGEWDKLVPTINERKTVCVPFCLEVSCENEIKKVTGELSLELAPKDENGEVDTRAPSMGAKSLCIPFDQPKDDLGPKCINPNCKNAPKSWTNFGRSY
ncbi:putative proline--tRNA ligase C19C7.06 [Diplonema papillatum]|nr:putative proline--tRNA ligase C19C7.06 [Diplonema papillatum]